MTESLQERAKRIVDNLWMSNGGVAACYAARDAIVALAQDYYVEQTAEVRRGQWCETMRTLCCESERYDVTSPHPFNGLQHKRSVEL